jgi:AraC-like DNA-binding protein
MQPQFIKVPDSPQSAFLIRDMVVPYFSNPYHYHPELELTYIYKSSGTRYIGDSIEPFTNGDLVLVGSNLPHLWKNDKNYYEGDPSVQAQAIVIQFRENIFGKEFWDLQEMRSIRNLILKSRQGIKIRKENKKEMIDLMHIMIDQKGAEQLISLLSLLHLIAESKDTKLLATKAFSNNLMETGAERINAVFAFVFERFTEEIRLNEIADVANMSPTAFCRYFKTHTHKTFSQFVIEIRIHHSCKLIIKEELNLSEIAFKCGFNNSSYFTKKFKKVMGMTPFEYKRKFGNAFAEVF